MATTSEAIRRLRMIFETQGADAAVAEMKKLETAETSLGTSSLNLDRAFGNLERRYSETARATAEYERAMRTLNAAVAQNPALAERAAAVQATVAARYQATMQASKEAHQAQTVYGVGMNALSQQAATFAASTGTAGSMLQALGRGGLVAAVGLGAVALAYNKIDEGVTNVAKYARETKQFAEATGLTTSQVQSLNKEAARFGVSTEELHSGLMKFTAGFEEVRNGGGAMLDTIRKISPALADQAVSASNEEEALRIVGQALREARNEFDRARLAREAFGRGGTNIALMMKDIDIGSLPSRGLSKAVIDDLARLQSEIDARSTNISTKIYASFGKPFLDAKNDVLAYIEAVMKIGTASDASKAQGGKDIVNQLSMMFPLIAAARNTFEAYSGGAENAAKKTDELASAQERLADAFKKTAEASSVNARGLFRSEMTKEEPGSDERRYEVLKQTMALYPDLVAQDAVRMRLLDGQLRIAQAMPGVAQQQAQQWARINQLMLEGKDFQTAVTLSSKERAIVQAQISTAAQQQLVNLRNQAGVAAAVTGADKIRAQEQATINALLQQGVSLEQAQAIAAQERANAEAAVNAAVERQIISLNESTQLIRAQIADLEEQAGSAQKILGVHEMMVRTQQAYNQALREGASQEEASALAAATYNNLLAQRAMQLAQIREQQRQQAAQAYDQAIAQMNQLAEQTSQQSNQRMQSAQLAAASSLISEIQSLAGQIPALQQLLEEMRGPYGAAITWNTDRLMPILQAARGAVADQPRQQREGQALDQLKQLQDQYRLSAAGTDEEKAQIQRQITYEKLLKDGVAASLAQQIADQELANTMQDLKKSVDANTSALQAQLDPIYTEGRAALRIGYYGEGSGGTMRTVTGTGYANENAPAGGQGSGSNLIVINNNFQAGAVMGDRRTQYQAANAYGRAIASTGSK